jgi:hypothetical protein
MTDESDDIYLARSLVNPRDVLAQVKDEATFLKFLRTLGEDFAADRRLEAETPTSPYAASSLGWEHGTIDGFLDAAWACGVANPEGGSGGNPWHRCAEILLRGKTYE